MQNETRTIVEISGITNEGAGVGRLDNMAVFVPGTLPGERVAAALYEQKRSFARARLLDVLSANPERIVPECPYAAVCGGCGFLHAAYPLQLRLKQEIVASALQRIGGISYAVPLPLGAARQTHYRNRALLHVEQAKLGFYAPGTHTVCEIAACQLLRPALNQLLQTLRTVIAQQPEQMRGVRHVLLRCNADETELLLAFVGGEQSALTKLAWQLTAREALLSSVWLNSGQPVYSVYGPSWQLLSGCDGFADRVGSVQLRLAPAAFLQVHPEQTSLLYDTVQDLAMLQGNETLFDLYCGTGSIALFLAAAAGKVIGVESYAPATRNAEENAKRNQAQNCRFLTAAVEDALPPLLAVGEIPDVAILDPPRAGCAERALASLAAAHPSRIVYVSCDPATLARDAKRLAALQYPLKRLQPVDLFCQTPRIETVCLFERE